MKKRVDRIFAVATLAMDFVAIGASLVLAYWLRLESKIIPIFRGVPPIGPYRDALPIVASIVLFNFVLLRLYDPKRNSPFVQEIYGIAKAVALSVALMIVVTFLSRYFPYSRGTILISFFTTTFVVGSGRILMRWLRSSLRRQGVGVIKTVIVGTTESAMKVRDRIKMHPNLGYKLIGFVSDEADAYEEVIGGLDSLDEIIEREGIDEVMVAHPLSGNGNVTDAIVRYSKGGVEFKVIPDILEMIASKVIMDDTGGVPTLMVRQVALSGWNAFVKRIVDITLASIGLIISAPLWLVIALAIKLDSPGPVLLKHKRIGKGGKIFSVYKFRTMVSNAQEILNRYLEENPKAKAEFEATFKLKDDPRKTQVGNFLRKTSLDELPQLINVLRGDMSLVGPRPIVPQELEKYGKWKGIILNVLPGITGFWQVSGRNDVSYEERIKLDLYYVENWSLLLDIEILLRTIPVVLTSRGAY
ncbi:MAG: sugar transferase [bacterium]